MHGRHPCPEACIVGFMSLHTPYNMHSVYGAGGPALAGNRRRARQLAPAANHLCPTHAKRRRYLPMPAVARHAGMQNARAAGLETARCMGTGHQAPMRMPARQPVAPPQRESRRLSVMSRLLEHLCCVTRRQALGSLGVRARAPAQQRSPSQTLRHPTRPGTIMCRGMCHSIASRRRWLRVGGRAGRTLALTQTLARGARHLRLKLCTLR